MDYKSATDSYSTLIILLCDGVPVGTLSVTKRNDGPLDCEMFYPSQILEFEGVISSNKYAMIKNFKLEDGNFLSTLFLQECSSFFTVNGARIDVINVDKAMVRYYERIQLGYRHVPGIEFSHPDYGNMSCVMLRNMNREDSHASKTIDDVIKSFSGTQ